MYSALIYSARTHDDAQVLQDCYELAKQTELLDGVALRFKILSSGLHAFSLSSGDLEILNTLPARACLLYTSDAADE